MRGVYRNIQNYTTQQKLENKENLELQQIKSEPQTIPIVTRKDENLFQRVKAFHKILKPQIFKHFSHIDPIGKMLEPSAGNLSEDPTYDDVKLQHQLHTLLICEKHFQKMDEKTL